MRLSGDTLHDLGGWLQEGHAQDCWANRQAATPHPTGRASCAAGRRARSPGRAAAPRPWIRRTAGPAPRCARRCPAPYGVRTKPGYDTSHQAHFVQCGCVARSQGGARGYDARALPSAPEGSACGSLPVWLSVVPLHSRELRTSPDERGLALGPAGSRAPHTPALWAHGSPASGCPRPPGAAGGPHVFQDSSTPQQMSTLVRPLFALEAPPSTPAPSPEPSSLSPTSNRSSSGPVVLRISSSSAFRRSSSAYGGPSATHAKDWFGHHSVPWHTTTVPPW
jgi:hypothetical protein